MNDRTMVKVRCDKELLSIRTVSWGRKSPFWFAILRSELQQLEQRPKNRLISSDCGSFAVRSAADAAAGWHEDAGDPVHLASGRLHWRRTRVERDDPAAL